MATVSKSVAVLETFGDRKVHVITWTALTTTNADGDPIEMPGSADRSFQVYGTFGAGGTIVLEGSNDPTTAGATYATVEDSAGTAISKTAASIEAVGPVTRWLRPRVTAGDGTTSLTVRLLVRRA